MGRGTWGHRGRESPWQRVRSSAPHRICFILVSGCFQRGGDRGLQREERGEQTPASDADKSVPNIGPCHEGLVFHKTIPAINWVLMCGAAPARQPSRQPAAWRSELNGSCRRFPLGHVPLRRGTARHSPGTPPSLMWVEPPPARDLPRGRAPARPRQLPGSWAGPRRDPRPPQSWSGFTWGKLRHCEAVGGERDPPSWPAPGTPSPPCGPGGR